MSPTMNCAVTLSFLLVWVNGHDCNESNSHRENSNSRGINSDGIPAPPFPTPGHCSGLGEFCGSWMRSPKELWDCCLADGVFCDKSVALWGSGGGICRFKTNLGKCMQKDFPCGSFEGYEAECCEGDCVLQGVVPEATTFKPLIPTTPGNATTNGTNVTDVTEVVTIQSIENDGPLPDQVYTHLRGMRKVVQGQGPILASNIGRCSEGGDPGSGGINLGGSGQIILILAIFSSVF